MHLTASRSRWQGKLARCVPSLNPLRRCVACDGLFELMTWSSVCEFIRIRLARNMPLPRIAEALLDACCSTNVRQRSAARAFMFAGFLAARVFCEAHSAFLGFASEYDAPHRSRPLGASELTTRPLSSSSSITISERPCYDSV